MPGLSELHLERRQNISFMPNCTWRPGLDDVITPNVFTLVPPDELGAPRMGVFVRLMNWVMNWKLVLSEIENAFTMLMSDVASPGPRNAPAAQVPKVLTAGSVTEAGFRKCGPKTPKVCGSLGLVNEPSPG